MAQVWLSVIKGEMIVREGNVQALELEPLIEKHNHLSKRLIGV